MAINWDGAQMPLQRGRVAIVTGGAQGLGYECARQLVMHGARVLIADWDEPKARTTVQDLRALAVATPGAGDVEFVRVDLGCMASVQAFAETVHTKLECLDMLINNAGVGVPLTRQCTDGYRMQFGINHLGHFYLTTLLMDLLRKATAARVVNVTSMAHRQELSYYLSYIGGAAPTLDFATLASGDGDTAWMAYEKSKLCNLLFTYELDRRLRAAGITNVESVAAHPGITRTDIWGFLGFLLALILQSIAMGSLPILYAATAANVKGGEFFGPRGWRGCAGYPTREESSPESYSKASAQALWTLSEQLTKTPFALE